MGRLINNFRPYARILLVIWVILIIILAILPNLPTPRIGGRLIPIRLDYPIHYLEHTLLAFLAVISFVYDRRQLTRILITLSTLIAFAVFSEMLQLLIPARTFEFKDMFLNIAGIITGTIIALAVTADQKLSETTKTQR
ncbi:MAG: VanZ family protein [Bacteroidales bacterium]|nr:VanZ family protein [Bacteroidales bacterium]